MHVSESQTARENQAKKCNATACERGGGDGGGDVATDFATQRPAAHTVAIRTHTCARTHTAHYMRTVVANGPSPSSRSKRHANANASGVSYAK